MATYPFKEIENKWQEKWKASNVDATPQPTPERPPYFLLVMFPYPSGRLHMGHVRNYTIGDILARYHRRKGFAVMHPIGWDSFGLPAENAAIKNGIHPAKWTWENIGHMRDQLKTMAISYDWDREVATCDPSYYRWNQWIFIKMFEKGLAYRKKAAVNWCPKCQTTLANEQVHDGRCWRCDTEVTQKELTQWFLKITDYAGELLSGHKQLASKPPLGWPPEVITMQKNWIGESQGANITFPMVQSNTVSDEKLMVFTTRPDTLFGATFAVLAPEHPLVDKLTSPAQKNAVTEYRAQAKKLTKFFRTSADRVKTGVNTGGFVKNPINGENIPVWIADYVLTDYGTGAIMAVPAHDQRDFEFAKKFGIPIRRVIADPTKPSDSAELTAAFEEIGVMMNSGSYDGLSSDEAKAKITAELKAKGAGDSVTTYKLRDWLISRQRYWGTPIPMLYCANCDVQSVPLSDLPVLLPEDVKLTGEGESPLAQAEKWVNTTCPKCGGPARRETDTMDTFVDSSWYYLRYCDPHNDSAPFDPEKAKTWIPVSQYIGGIEHACMHLIYSRFFHKVLREFKMVSVDEPFQSLLTQGMVTLGGTAMSKSKGNVVDPADVIGRFGTDTCRLFIMFAAPPTQQLEWSDNQVEGIWRFLNRVWRLGLIFSKNEDDQAPKRSLDASSRVVNPKELARVLNLTIDSVTKDIERDFGFNTAIARIMELVNSLYLYPELGDSVSQDAFEKCLQLLQPFAPHLSEELWERLGHFTPLTNEPWPVADKKLMIENEVEIVIQVNGKVKHKITVKANTLETEVTSIALKALEEKGIKLKLKRVIYVPNKLLNFVVENI